MKFGTFDDNILQTFMYVAPPNPEFRGSQMEWE